MESTDPTAYTELDDSWLNANDKTNLLKHIKKLYTTKFSWADNTLIKSIVKHHYNLTIKQMDKIGYMKEKESMTLEDFLEQM